MVKKWKEKKVYKIWQPHVLFRKLKKDLLTKRPINWLTLKQEKQLYFLSHFTSAAIELARKRFLNDVKHILKYRWHILLFWLWSTSRSLLNRWSADKRSNSQTLQDKTTAAYCFIFFIKLSNTARNERFQH